MKLTLKGKEIKVEPNGAGGIDIELTEKETVQLVRSLLMDLIVHYESADAVAYQAISRMTRAQEYQKQKYNDPELTTILAPYLDEERGAEDESD